MLLKNRINRKSINTEYLNVDYRNFFLRLLLEQTDKQYFLLQNITLTVLLFKEIPEVYKKCNTKQN